MIVFQDDYGYDVRLSFSDHPFSRHPKHVLVICRYNGRWLLTNHAVRGWEFPGGKVEEGETAEQAAIREVREETGGIVQKIMYIGQYEVKRPNETIVKIFILLVLSLWNKGSRISKQMVLCSLSICQMT